MQNRWSAAEARRFVDDYGRQGHNADLALRVYTSRLLGAEPALVRHGGGNTSVKTRAGDLAGDDVAVVCVKGSGWDLAAIEPAGLPAVRLAPLRRLQALDRLGDDVMVNALRCNLLDAAAPTPSVETLLHAFLPHAYVDHTHANAVLALSDQPDGLEICRAVFGDAMALVDYVMPGFQLAQVVARAFDRQPRVDGVVLHKHGIVTVGDGAEQAYERMIHMVTLAEARIARGRAVVVSAAVSAPPLPALSPSLSPSPAADVLPLLRGACAAPLGDGRYRRLVASLRDGPAALAFCNRADLPEAAWRGVVTPDHSIRIKNRPLVLSAPEAGRLDAYREDVRRRVAQYAEEYRAYFARHDARTAGRRVMLDPLPRVLLVPGVGVVGLGPSKAEAEIAADLAETTIATVGAAATDASLNELWNEHMSYASSEPLADSSADMLEAPTGVAAAPSTANAASPQTL